MILIRFPLSFILSSSFLLFSKLPTDGTKRLQSSNTRERIPSKAQLACERELTIWVIIISIDADCSCFYIITMAHISLVFPF